MVVKNTTAHSTALGTLFASSASCAETPQAGSVSSTERFCWVLEAGRSKGKEGGLRRDGPCPCPHVDLSQGHEPHEAGRTLATSSPGGDWVSPRAWRDTSVQTTAYLGLRHQQLHPPWLSEARAQIPAKDRGRSAPSGPPEKGSGVRRPHSGDRSSRSMPRRLPLPCSTARLVRTESLPQHPRCHPLTCNGPSLGLSGPWGWPHLSPFQKALGSGVRGGAGAGEDEEEEEEEGYRYIWMRCGISSNSLISLPGIRTTTARQLAFPKPPNTSVTDTNLFTASL